MKTLGSHLRISLPVLVLTGFAMSVAGCGGDSGGSSGGGGVTAYTIGGTISGLTGSGLVLADGGQTASPAASATSFSFATAEASGTSYSVTVSTQPSGQTCTVTDGSGTIASANVSTIELDCTAKSASTGYLIDAPVQGVIYTTSSGLSGISATDGSFQYNSGDSVAFTVLGISLGGETAVPSTGIVTPATITGASVTSTSTENIAVFLQTLSQVSANASSGGSTTSGNLVMPTGTLATALQSALSTTSLATAVANLSTALSSTGVSGLLSTPVTPVTAASAAAALQAAITAATSAASNTSYVNTVLNVTCNAPCTGGATLALLGNGSVTGVTTSGKIVFGTWNVPSAGAIAFQAAAFNGGSASGTLPAGQTSCASCVNITQHSGGAATGDLSEITASGGAATTTDSGLWYGLVSPNAAGAEQNGLDTAVVIGVAEPNGTFLATNGNTLLSGSWSTSAFSASGTTTDGSTVTVDGTVSSTGGSGTISSAGTTMGTVTLSRTAPLLTTVTAPITINWANSFTTTCGDCNPSVTIYASNTANTGGASIQYTNPWNNGNGGAAGQGSATTLSTTFSPGSFVLPGTYSYTVLVNGNDGGAEGGSSSAGIACTVTGGATGKFTTSSTSAEATLPAITVTCAN